MNELKEKRRISNIFFVNRLRLKIIRIINYVVCMVIEKNILGNFFDVYLI